ncbi:MAG: roadblock/LC7 domain-containing protein [Candidatus Thermoplasmatota archaeon]
MARHEQLERLLEDLAKSPGVLGAAILSRDGLSVKAVGHQELARETFSAMSATIYGAAEIALGELDSTHLRHIIAQTDRVKVIMLGATTDLLLVIYAQADAALEPLLQRAVAAAGTVAPVIIEG